MVKIGITYSYAHARKEMWCRLTGGTGKNEDTTTNSTIRRYICMNTLFVTVENKNTPLSLKMNQSLHERTRYPDARINIFTPVSQSVS